MKKTIILLSLIFACGLVVYLISGKAESLRLGDVKSPEWLEDDSITAISNRLRADFTLTMDEAADKIKEQHPEVSDSDITKYIDRHYIETKVIDDTLRVHRKSPRNLNLLNPEFNGFVKNRGEKASDDRIAFVDSILDFYSGLNPEGLAHEVTYRFTIDVPYDKSLSGEMLRVWMPVPFESVRQNDIKILSAYPSEYIRSDFGKSPHNSIYFEAPAVEVVGDTAHFEYVAQFVTRGQYFSPEQILSAIKSYDKDSENYKKYTSFGSQHIVRMDSLAKQIVGEETNPYLCSEKVYDYIVNNYLWAGAREYSTIKCIPEYVVRECHGDCGQVSLLYISLMRTLGIPARWESGWMLHPGEKNLHDWAEVYFNGVGWVPVDVSFGRYTNASNTAVKNFYSTGMDSHRLAVNRDICAELYPEKTFLRSETVDFQLGEVECSKGNLFYPGWSQHLELIEVKPIKIQN